MSNPSLPITRIELAFKRFQQSVSPDDARTFQSTVLKDVCDAAIEIESRQRQRGISQNLRRIEPFLEGIEKYSKAVDTLCNGTPFLPWIWAPIKLMLQVLNPLDPCEPFTNHRKLAAEQSSILDTLLDTYAEIGKCLPRFDRFQSTFTTTPDMQQVLALVYEDIIEFHRRAYKFFRRKAWQQLFRPLWTDSAATFNKILDRLRKHTDLVDKDAVSFDIVEASITRKKIDDEFEKAEDERTNSHLQAVLSWLGVEDRLQADDLLRLQDKRFPETCQWLFNAQQYSTWLANPTKHPILWLRGIPGSGKSILCAHVIKELTFSMPDAYVLSYFCHYKLHSELDDCSHLLRSLASQLVRRDTDLAAVLWQTYVRAGRTASIANLQTSLSTLINASPTTKIIIDGLDECDSKEHKSILDTLFSLCSTKKGDCSLLISSRDNPLMSKKFKDCLVLSLRDEHRAIQSDITAFVSGKLDEALKDWGLVITSDARDTIQEALISRANGMFLWVELVIDGFQFSPSNDQILDLVEKLPKTLTEAYDRIVDKINVVAGASLFDSTTCVLEWVTYSKHLLNEDELLSAMGSRLSSSADHEPRTALSRILEFCKPLVEVTNARKVDFIHFTAKEYFMETSSKHHIPKVVAHLNIAQSCLNYLNTTEIFLKDDRKLDRYVQIIQRKRAIHHYAFANWLSHLDLSTCSIKSQIPPVSLADRLIRLRWVMKCKEPLDNVSTPTKLPFQFSIWERDPLISNLLHAITTFNDKMKKCELHSKSLQKVYDTKAEDDPTFMTIIADQYAIDVSALLRMTTDTDVPDGIDLNSLFGFQQSSGGQTFLCRHSSCSRVLIGFATQEERETHENSHTRQFQCTVPDCLWEGRNFSTKGKLQTHKKRHHAEKASFELPELILSDPEDLQQPPEHVSTIPDNDDDDFKHTSRPHQYSPQQNMDSLQDDFMDLSLEKFVLFYAEILLRDHEEQSTSHNYSDRYVAIVREHTGNDDEDSYAIYSEVLELLKDDLSLWIEFSNLNDMIGIGTAATIAALVFKSTAFEGLKSRLIGMSTAMSKAATVKEMILYLTESLRA